MVVCGYRPGTLHRDSSSKFRVPEGLRETYSSCTFFLTVEWSPGRPRGIPGHRPIRGHREPTGLLPIRGPGDPPGPIWGPRPRGPIRGPRGPIRGPPRTGPIRGPPRTGPIRGPILRGPIGGRGRPTKGVRGPVGTPKPKGLGLLRSTSTFLSVCVNALSFVRVFVLKVLLSLYTRFFLSLYRFRNVRIVIWKRWIIIKLKDSDFNLQP